jgi:uncharacterized CHY-type Zn-finger protein
VEIEISGIPVRGIEVDSHTGCVHYRSTLDIVAIKFKCCQTYYSCSYCHDTESRHPAQIWKRSEFGQKAILCGACGGELTINQYLKCQARCRRLKEKGADDVTAVPSSIQSSLRTTLPFVLRSMSYRSRSFHIEAHGCCRRKCIRIRSSWRIDQLDTNLLFAIRSDAVGGADNM